MMACVDTPLSCFHFYFILIGVMRLFGVVCSNKTCLSNDERQRMEARDGLSIHSLKIFLAAREALFFFFFSFFGEGDSDKVGG